jgi:hypothetical protein
MKLHTLGTGGPRLDSTRGSACHVLEVAGRHLMFDVGRGAIRGLAANGLPIAEIGPLFISHLPLINRADGILHRYAKEAAISVEDERTLLIFSPTLKSLIERAPKT